MKIVAIGSLPYDLELACFGTLSRCIKAGHDVYLIIAKNKTKWTQTKMDKLAKASQQIGVSQVCFTERFELSAVTQDNAVVLASFLKTISPAVVIMPFWKSHNQMRRILANNSLIACRGVGSILMYEVEKNRAFRPSVYFAISTNDFELKRSLLLEYSGSINEASINRKANCLRLDLLGMKKNQQNMSPQTEAPRRKSKSSTTKVMLDHKYAQQILLADDGHIETETLDMNDVAVQTNPPIITIAERCKTGIFIEVFESHRMLLLDSHDLF
jgi:hypothetical protein